MYLVRAPCKKTDRSVGMSLDKYEYIIIITIISKGVCPNSLGHNVEKFQEGNFKPLITKIHEERMYLDLFFIFYAAVLVAAVASTRSATQQSARKIVRSICRVFEPALARPRTAWGGRTRDHLSMHMRVQLAAQ